jgi:alkylation response protein AidB-like acyl-CoA dehydrogenase
MDLGFSKSEKLLVESARKFLEKEAAGIFREAELTKEGYSRPLWHKMAELGWMGILFPGQYQGMDGNILELTLLLEEMGRALVPGPFIATMISGYGLLRYGTKMQKEQILPSLTAGRQILIPCFTSPEPAGGDMNRKEQADFKDDHYRLSATRLFVSYAQSADWFLYEAATRKGKTLLLIPANTPGISCRPFETLAADRQCELALDQVYVSASNRVGTEGGAAEIINEIQQWGALSESAYILGLLEKVLEMAVKHAKIREQFGRPIGSFQTIQHQCADMLADIDKLKFLTYQAACKLSAGAFAGREIHMAKARASDASRRVTLLGIKIHGGVGITQEYDLQFYFRRAKASETAFGDGDFHRERVARTLGLWAS